MNYLGHAYLSMNNADTLCGNMIGDFVKGKIALNQFPLPIRQGIELHRKIDTFTDVHPAIAQAKEIFRPRYHLYAGAVVDTVLDHFIANDQRLFPDEAALDLFAAQTYALLATRQSFFPQPFLPYFDSMVAHNWLLNYRSEQGLNQSLRGLMRRAKHISEVETAFDLLMANRSVLQHYYAVFIDEVIDFVKIELAGE